MSFGNIDVKSGMIFLNAAHLSKSHMYCKGVRLAAETFILNNKLKLLCIFHHIQSYCMISEDLEYNTQ